MSLSTRSPLNCVAMSSPPLGCVDLVGTTFSLLPKLGFSCVEKKVWVLIIFRLQNLGFLNGRHLVIKTSARSLPVYRHDRVMATTSSWSVVQHCEFGVLQGVTVDQLPFWVPGGPNHGWVTDLPPFSRPYQDGTSLVCSGTSSRTGHPL